MQHEHEQLPRVGGQAGCREGHAGRPREARQEQAEGNQGEPLQRPEAQERGGHRCEKIARHGWP